MNISLDTLIANPTSVAELSQSAVPGILTQIAALNSALAARMLQAADARDVAQAPDVMLTLEQAGERIHETPEWIRRQAKKLPWVKRISRKKFLVSEQALTRWLASRKA
jgi:hypothetical protein